MPLFGAVVVHVPLSHGRAIEPISVLVLASENRHGQRVGVRACRRRLQAAG
jgi:hypothetical protein